jgi:CHAT domain-containing protein
MLTSLCFRRVRLPEEDLELAKEWLACPGRFWWLGVPTMVASQWKVDSASTAALMINFHTRLKDDTLNAKSTKALALRQASLDLMRDPRYRHPFFWASFIMIGVGV